MPDYLKLRKNLNCKLRDHGLLVTRDHKLDLYLNDNSGEILHVHCEVMLHKSMLKSHGRNEVVHAYAVVLESEHPLHPEESVIDLVAMLKLLELAEQYFPQLSNRNIPKKKRPKNAAHHRSEQNIDEGSGSEGPDLGYESADGPESFKKLSGTLIGNPYCPGSGPHYHEGERYRGGLDQGQLPADPPECNYREQIRNHL